jgi:hypothetical protein
MSYAALVQVDVDPDSDVEHRRSVLNQFVIPELEKLPGFRSAMWLNDGKGVGTCAARFDTEDQATGALGILAPSNGPRVVSSGTCKVELEA